MRLGFLSPSVTLRLALLGAAAALLLAPQGASAVSVSIGFDNGDEPSVFTQEQLGCSSAGEQGQVQCSGGELVDFVGDWTVNSLDLFADPDPTVSNIIAVTNNTAATQTFVITVTLPIAPAFGPPSFIKGSVSGSVTDTSGNGNGATFATAGGNPIYTALIDGASVATLLDPSLSVVTAGFGSANLPVDDFGIPNAVSIPVGTLTGIAITLRFSLTAGDSASLTSVFNVEPIPEPGTAILMAAGLIGLARMGRSRA